MMPKWRPPRRRRLRPARRASLKPNETKTQVMDMFSKQKKSWRALGTLCLLAGLLSGCSSKDDELDQFIADTKKEPGGRVEPLPELKPYESYAYESSGARSPFMPGGSGASNAGAL